MIDLIKLEYKIYKNHYGGYYQVQYRKPNDIWQTVTEHESYWDECGRYRYHDIAKQFGSIEEAKDFMADLREELSKQAKGVEEVYHEKV